MQPGVSIVVCTYNGARRLPDTLQHLSNQIVDKSILWEVIVVDNASTDHTQDVVKEKIAQYQNFRLIKENRAGKSNALETGFGVAKYEYLLICDDDNWLEENYIQTAYNIMQANKDIGVLGGKSIAVCETTQPVWFDSLKQAYAVGDQAGSEKRGYVKVVWGAGMVLRKSVWQQLQVAGFKQILSCRKGSKLTSGGDDELCLAVQLTGHKIFYDSRLILSHFIPKNRLSEKYIKELVRATAYSAIALDPYGYIIKLTNNQPVDLNAYKQKWRKRSYSLLKELAKDFSLYVKSRRHNNLAFCVLYEKKVVLFKLYLLHAEEMYINLLQVYHLKSSLDAQKRREMNDIVYQ